MPRVKVRSEFSSRLVVLGNPRLEVQLSSCEGNPDFIFLKLLQF